MTGNTLYRDQSWAVLQGFFKRSEASCESMGQDYTRAVAWQHVLSYDFLYPGLDSSQRTTFLNKLNFMVNCIVSRGNLVTDTDQTVGDYFAIAMFYVSTGSYNSTGVTAWNTTRFGGWDATAASITGTNMRNAIKYYFETMAAGGEWVESSHYNVNTMKGSLLPNEALKTAGITKFPRSMRGFQAQLCHSSTITRPGCPTPIRTSGATPTRMSPGICTEVKR